MRDPSFQRIGLTQLYANRDDDELGELFRGLSSSRKVVLKIVTELTARISGSEPTLVLIDEPETHLHPPLLAAFLKSVGACLEAFDGYAIIASHSPVVPAGNAGEIRPIAASLSRLEPGGGAERVP